MTRWSNVTLRILWVHTYTKKEYCQFWNFQKFCRKVCLPITFLSDFWFLSKMHVCLRKFLFICNFFEFYLEVEACRVTVYGLRLGSNIGSINFRFNPRKKGTHLYRMYLCICYYSVRCNYYLFFLQHFWFLAIKTSSVPILDHVPQSQI